MKKLLLTSLFFTSISLFAQPTQKEKIETIKYSTILDITSITTQIKTLDTFIKFKLSTKYNEMKEINGSKYSFFKENLKEDDFKYFEESSNRIKEDLNKFLEKGKKVNKKTNQILEKDKNFNKFLENNFKTNEESLFN